MAHAAPMGAPHSAARSVGPALQRSHSRAGGSGCHSGTDAELDQRRIISWRGSSVLGTKEANTIGLSRTQQTLTARRQQVRSRIQRVEAVADC
jgi:hypothetical protein